MVQVIVWNGSNRPHRISITSAGFSGTVPAVGSLLTVRQGAFDGTIIGQIQITSINGASRSAAYELTQGSHPEVGDFVILSGSYAEVERVTHMPSRRGDIVDILNDGVHPGTKIVTGPNWNDPCDYSTAYGRALTAQERTNGEWPDFVIVDLPGVTIQQARRQVVQELGIALDVPSIGKMIKIDAALLPQAAINALRDDGRVTATWPQLQSVLRLKEGLTLQSIRNSLTEKNPNALTELY